MDVERLQKIIDKYDYWDMRVKIIDCNYFADEVTIVYDDGESGEICYLFCACYKVIFEHVKSYDKLKPAKEMTIGQIPYFLQDVSVGACAEDGADFYTCKINMFPLNVEIWCKDIQVFKV